MTSALPTTLLTPNPKVGNGYPGTMYFKTRTVTAPARPPAIKANPTNKMTRAFHAMPFPEYEYESADSLVLSIEFILLVSIRINIDPISNVGWRGREGKGPYMSIPRTLQIKGIQSTNLTWTSPPLAVFE